MDEALFVRGLERGRDLKADRQRIGEGDASARQSLGQRLAWHELHDQERRSVGAIEAMNRGDVRVTERGEHTRFALESGESFRIADGY